MDTRACVEVGIEDAFVLSLSLKNKTLLCPNHTMDADAVGRLRKHKLTHTHTQRHTHGVYIRTYTHTHLHSHTREIQ